MLRICDIMTADVLTVSPDTPLRVAMEVLTARHVSGAPVLAGQRVVGVVSATDIVAYAIGDQRLAGEPPAMPGDAAWEPGDDLPDSALRALQGEGNESGFDDAGGGGASDPPSAPRRGLDPLDESTVADAMTWGVYSLPPDTDVVRAAECMRAAEVHRMLVMDEGRLLGIVTTMDLLRAVASGRLVSAE